MSWLPLLLPGLIALLGSWRASVAARTAQTKASATLQAQVAGLLSAARDARHEIRDLRADMAALVDRHAECERNVQTLRDELRGKQRDETAGGGSLHHLAREDDTGPYRRK